MFLNMSKTISEKIDPNRMSKQPFGLKAESTLQRITFTPSSANLGETLYINIPNLSGNNVLVPGSVYLAFNIDVAGHVNNTLVNNIGRSLVSNFKVVLGGETLQDTKRYDLFMTYQDLFMSSKERYRRLKQGISTLNMRKLRTGAGDASTSNAGDVALGKIYSNRYHIPINHPILDDHGVFYSRGLRETLMFEITLASILDIVNFTDNTKQPTYTLKNLAELEYSSISSDYLAQQASSAYASGKGFYYENVLLHKTFDISKTVDSVINEHVNVPRRSMTGILCLFNDTITPGTRNSEKFINPDIQSVSININGMPNKLYSKEMIVTDFYDSIMKRYGKENEGDDYNSIVPANFYINGAYGLWIDLRTFPDEVIHGGGFTLDSTSDGVKLEIRRKVGSTAGKITCYMYVVSDALVEIMNSGLDSIKY